MKVTGLAFLGIRTMQYDAMVRLFRDTMGLDVARQVPHHAAFRLSDGTPVEVYDPSDDFHAFFGSGPVVGFRVEDFDEARAHLRAAGVALIGPVQHAQGTSWNHFRGPDGNVYEIMGPGGLGGTGS